MTLITIEAIQKKLKFVKLNLKNEIFFTRNLRKRVSNSFERIV